MKDIPAGSSIGIEAPAKVNLFLEVAGRRPDGYHDLESIFQAISIYDTLTIESTRSGAVTISCNVKTLETPENLAVEAARAFLDAAGLDTGLHIALEKRIPVRAGLGGGSSDAAAVLVGLNRLAGAPFTNDDLRAMAASLGSDVPFFVEGGTALVEGRGERVRQMDFGGVFYFVVLYPGFGVSTAAVYKNLRLKLTGEKRNVKVLWDLMSTGNLDAAEGEFFNRLEETAIGLDDRLGKLKLRMSLRTGGASVLVSGSGSSLFSAFADKHRALKAYEALKAATPGELYFAGSAMRRAPAVHPKGDNGGDF